MEVPLEEGTKSSRGRRAVAAGCRGAVLPETWENIRAEGRREHAKTRGVWIGANYNAWKS